MAVEMILATSGPPCAFCTATLLMPYSMAWRTRTLPMAPPEFGLRRLNTTYGRVELHGQMLNLGSFLAIRPGIAVGSTPVSSTRSYWPVGPACSSDNWVCAEVTPSVRVISLTYWCRTESVDCFQAGFFIMVLALPGT